MYDCESIRKLVYPYLDNELDVKEGLRVQSHLNECPCCASLYQAEKVFLDDLRAGLQPPPPAPSGLGAQIRQQLEAAARSQTFSPARLAIWVRRLALSLAGVPFVVGIGVFAARALTPQSELVETAVRGHDRLVRGQTGLDLRTREPQAVVRWVAETLDFPVSPTLSEVAPFRLMGARLIEFGEQQAVLILFRVEPKASSIVEPKASSINEGEYVSLFLSHTPRIRRMVHPVKMADGPPTPFKGLVFYPGDHGGYRTIAWSDGNLNYVLVSSQSRIAREACVLCHIADPERIAGFSPQF